MVLPPGPPLLLLMLLLVTTKPALRLHGHVLEAASRLSRGGIEATGRLPRGGIVLCEDGNDTEFLHGLTRDGEIFRFCQNRVVLLGQRNGLLGDVTGGEFAGACFDPSGQWLFVNIQNPGITFAITGPWERGPL